jgi:regulatory protein
MTKSARGGSKALPRTAFDDACRSLARRRMTENEIRQRLAKRHSQKEIDEAVGKLKEYRFIDDDALIVDYVKDRLKLSPRSARMMEFELSRRGIETDRFRHVFESEFPDYDEVEVARRALGSRLKRLKASKPQGRRERALRFLHSRGFSYEVMQEVWEEADREDNLKDDGS